MIDLTAIAKVDDYLLYRGIDKEDLERMINQQLASSFVKKLMEDEKFMQTIVKRETPYPFGFEQGITMYQSKLYVLTPAEAKEYQQLKEFQKQMKNFIQV